MTCRGNWPGAGLFPAAADTFPELLEVYLFELIFLNFLFDDVAILLLDFPPAGFPLLLQLIFLLVMGHIQLKQLHRGGVTAEL